MFRIPEIKKNYVIPGLTRYTPQGGTEVQLKKSALQAVNVQLDSRYRLVGRHKLHGNDNY